MSQRFQILVVLLCALGSISCGPRMSPVEAYERLLERPLPASANMKEWKLEGGIGEFRGFFSLTIPQTEFEEHFIESEFTREHSEEDAEALSIYSGELSNWTDQDVHIPFPSKHLVGKFPGKLVHVFRSEASGAVFIWVVPGREL